MFTKRGVARAPTNAFIRWDAPRPRARNAPGWWFPASRAACRYSQSACRRRRCSLAWRSKVEPASCVCLPWRAQPGGLVEDRTGLRTATRISLVLACALSPAFAGACRGQISGGGVGAAPGAGGGAGPTGAAGATALTVGPTGLHRLSRIEYDDTLRDLVGDTTRPGFAKLPEDVTDPFD